MDGWNTTFLLGRPIFRGYVSFREGINFGVSGCHVWNWRRFSIFWPWKKGAFRREHPSVQTEPFAALQHQDHHGLPNFVTWQSIGFDCSFAWHLRANRGMISNMLESRLEWLLTCVKCETMKSQPLFLTWFVCLRGIEYSSWWMMQQGLESRLAALTTDNISQPEQLLFLFNSFHYIFHFSIFFSFFEVPGHARLNSWWWQLHIVWTKNTWLPYIYTHII